MKVKDFILNIQFAYTSVLIAGNHKTKLEYTSTPEKFIARSGSRKSTLALVITLFASCFLITGFWEMFKKNAEVDMVFIIVFFIIHPIFGILSLRQFLWILRGMHVITIDNKFLTIDKRGTFFVKKKSYAINVIKNIKTSGFDSSGLIEDRIKNNLNLFFQVLFKQTIGVISFDCNKETIKLFSNLSDEEKNLILKEIRNRVSVGGGG